MKKLTYKFIKQYFEDYDCELFETEYINANTLMKYRCKCGNKECKIKFSHFKNGVRCMKCSGNEKLTFEFVKQYFEDRDCELLETEYIGSHTKMRYICDCENNKCKISFANFSSGRRCNKCKGKKIADKQRFTYKR